MSLASSGGLTVEPKEDFGAQRDLFDERLT
jgi:hypothetical protein